MSAAATSPALAEFQGQPCVDISLPQGDRVRIALHGAHVLSWTTADGQERLYLSPRALIDGQSAIRGGVPICFPQFNNRVLNGQTLPKHGFARTESWTLQSVEQTATFATARLRLGSNEATRKLWPHEFVATLTVELAADRLCLVFEVQNTGLQAWPFALALHTYLQVQDISQTRLLGLEGLVFWDGVQHLTQPEVRSLQLATGPDSALGFDAETDRVYEDVHRDAEADRPIHVTQANFEVRQQSGDTVRLSQSASLTDTVVWNPGVDRCAALNDMPPDGYRHMLCVEAACINSPVNLAAGQSWSGWQALDVLRA
ncbi:MAG: D-hexose-6-phosphate mutarotase [Pseudomonadota bacterium]